MIRRLIIGTLFIMNFIVLGCHGSLQKTNPSTPSIEFNENNIPQKVNAPDDQSTGNEQERFRKDNPWTGKVTIRKDKAILVDGEPFFPFGFYAADELGKLEMMSRYGFNSAICAGDVYAEPAKMERYLNAGHSLDMKAMPGAYDRDMHHKTKSTSPGAEELIRERITTLKNNPGIFSWYIADEPDGNQIPFTTIDRLANIVRSCDANHPVSLVTLSSSCDPYAKASDIHMNDPYYPMWRPNLSTVRAYIDSGIGSADGRKPYIAVLLGAFHDEKGKDLRCQSYLAIVRGAKGILFFSLQYVLNHPDVWREFRHLGREIDDFSPVIFSPDAAERITVDADPINPDIVLKKYQGRYYLIAVNYQRAGLTAKFDLSGLSVKPEIEVLYEDRKITLENNQFSDTFAGYDVHIYRIYPAIEDHGKTGSKPPEIAGLRPRPGETITLAAPMIKALFREGDDGTGIDPDSVTVEVDGKVVGPDNGLVINMKGVKNGISYIPKVDLARGRHTVVVRGKDLSGRVASRSWSFTTTNYPIPFIEKFDKPSRAWSPASGDWEVKDGAYMVDATGTEALSYVHDINLIGNYSLSFSAKASSFNEDSAILLWLNECFYPALFKIWFDRMNGYLSRINDNPHASGSVGSLQSGSWYQFTVLRKGRNINCLVDGKHVFSYYVPYSGNGGGFAIGARNARVAFRDVVVKRLIDPIAEEDESAMPVQKASSQKEDSYTIVQNETYLEEDKDTALHLVFTSPEVVERAGGMIRGKGAFVTTRAGKAYQPLEQNACLMFPDKHGFPIEKGTLELIVSDAGIAASCDADPILVHFFQEENRQVFLRINGGRLQFIVYAWAGSWICTKQRIPVWPLRSMHHITITWEGTRARAFIDGKEMEVESRERPGIIAAIPLTGKSTIFLGNNEKGNAPSPLAVLEMRLSRGVRYEKPEDFKDLGFLQ
ncbi:hypothetical protein [Candidatus Kuenenia sp.]|uniref:hypothetical protein n=1 Tax=Candidatus Kuenenia sp. TaxID=2499824 RepID=UPI0032203BDD